MTAPRLVRDALHVDRAQLAAAPGLCGAVGFAAPLVVGVAAGRPSDGAVVATGALIVGFANLGGPYRRRVHTMALACAGVAVSGLVGGLTGGSDALAVLLMGVWGLAAGLLVAVSKDASFVGILSAWALLLTADLSLDPSSAAREAGLLLLGGLVQTLLVVVVRVLARDAPERAAVAHALTLLAGYAREPSGESRRATADALAAAAAACDGARRPALRAVVDAAEWVRVDLTALDARAELGGAASDAVAALAQHVGSQSRPADRDRAAAAVAVLRERASAQPEADARQHGLALAGHLQAALRTGGRSGILAGRRSALATLRANATLRSVACRHAIRLAGALMVAVIAYRVLPLQRGYWVPLTVLFVLKPDFGTTYSRGIARALGTMAGVAIAVAVATTLDPGSWPVVALLAVGVAVAYTFFAAAYAIYTVALTLVIALLVELAGGSVVGALSDRIVDTALGAALALGAYALWPTWESGRVGVRLAELVDADRRWLGAILAAFADPGAFDAGALRTDRLAARLARTNADASIEHALAEPHGGRVAGASATAASLDRLAASGLVLVAALHELPRTAHSGAGPLAAALDATLDRLSKALRRGDAGAEPLATRWPHPPPSDGDRAGAILAAETRRIADTVELLTRVGSVAP